MIALAYSEHPLDSKERKGMIRVTPLMLLPNFDIYNQTPIDPQHQRVKHT